MTDLEPLFITGYTDGEGSFNIKITDSTTKIGWLTQVRFNLVAANNSANLAMLNSVRDFFGVGYVKIEKTGIFYLVTSFQECLIIREHFLNFPLITSKKVHFQIWSNVIDLMLNKEHLTLSGMLKIIALKEHSPLGLSTKLQFAFPNFTSIKTPLYTPDFTKLNINWIAGLINADGHFGFIITKNKKYKLREQCLLRIIITQHNRSLIVLKEIQKFLGYGVIYNRKTQNASDFKIQGLKLINKFIDQFKSAKLKALDYIDFCRGVNIMNKKGHLTQKGLVELSKISKKMNSKRTNFKN